jgi:hypothetical protein
VYEGTGQEVGVAAGRQTAAMTVSTRPITDNAGLNIIEVQASEFQIPGFFSQTVSNYILMLAFADCNCASTKKLKWHILKLISIKNFNI